MGQSVLSPAPHLIERRSAVRRRPQDDEAIARVRLRGGSEMTMIDVSDAGALVQGSTRLLPGTYVSAHIVGRTGPVLVRSCVIRAWVSAIGTGGVTYRSALAFQPHLDTSSVGYVVPETTRAPA